MTKRLPKPKEKLFTVRVTDDKLDDFKVVGELRGLSMSAMVHQFIVQAIREEKTKHPEAFAELKNGEIEQTQEETIELDLDDVVIDGSHPPAPTKIVIDTALPENLGLTLQELMDKYRKKKP